MSWRLTAFCLLSAGVLARTIGPPDAPVDRVGFVRYAYDATGRMTDARSFVNRSGLLISHNQFAYDSRGNLIKDGQSHGQEITTANAADTPTTTYEWGYQPTGATPADIGFSRLLKIGYPAQPNAPPNTQPRELLFGYGSAGATPGSQDQLNYTLSHIGAMTSNLAPLEIATFDFIGTDRRVGTSFAGGGLGVSLRDAAASALSGLDRFGRLKDLHYVNSAAAGGQTLFRAAYTYDIAGNRLSSNATRVDAAGTSLPNFKSQSHSYDGLDRLIGSRVGELDSSGAVPQATPFRADTWNLDALGNPNGRVMGAIGNGSVGFTEPGRISSGNLDAFGTPWAAVLAAPGDAANDDSQTTFQTDRRNQFTSFVLNTDLPAGAGMLGSMAPFNSVEPKYDAAGNCTFDGHYFYQYDAWNRLIQVNAAMQGQWLPEGAAAMVASSAGVNPAPLVPGALVKHFTYDALGRLIRTQSPFPDPAHADGSVRTERFYYDGIRRIQEVVVDPVRVIDLEGVEAPQQLAQMANQHGGDGSAVSIAGKAESPTNVDGSSSTASFESAQASMTGTSVGGIELANATLAREYIWGPGGSFVGAAVDELLVQIDGSGRAAWTMQDAGGDVVAVAVNTTGSGSSAVSATGSAASATGTSTNMRLAAQMEYGPYGEVIWAEHLLNHPTLHLGHKGLFIDRIDVGVADNSAGSAASAKTFGEPPRTVPLAFNLAQNRNRVLHMSWGRYLQQDPNASGANVLGTALSLGMRPRTGALIFDLDTHSQDGGNFYRYLQSNAYENADPLGLFSSMMFADKVPGIVSTILANAFAGAMVGAGVDGAMSYAEGDDWGTIGQRAAKGAVVGGVAGGAGGYAFASTAGLFGSLAARGAYAGAVTGFTGGVLNSGLKGGSIAEQFADGFFGAAFGAATGGSVGALSGWVGSGTSLAEDLAGAATRARNAVGSGGGGAYGTRVHSAFEAEVKAMGNPNLVTEQSYLNGVPVSRGTPGSIRVDVVNGPVTAPISIFDLKTGGAFLTSSRIQQIQSHIPGGSRVPVFEVRP